MIIAYLVALCVPLLISARWEYVLYIRKEAQRILENSWAFVWVNEALYEISFKFTSTKQE